MGPITLFDKSFLQALNLDEAVWFDHFSVTNVCPLFFAETLADLAKAPRNGRSGEDEVRSIAQKTPQLHGSPCVHHTTLALNNLIGQPIKMKTRQIPRAGGRRVRVEGQVGTVFEQDPEARAFGRRQEGMFEEVEREFAREWREELALMDLAAAASLLRAAGIEDVHCKSIEEARALATKIIGDEDRRADRMRLVLAFLGIRHGLWGRIQEVWSRFGRPPVRNYAPYAAYVAEVEVFFQICLASGLISTERPSNKLDIAYLFYLPFCMVFVSGDKLHRRCAPLFLDDDQDFVWGPDLKAEYKRVNEHFTSLPETTKDLGIMAFAHAPPDAADSLLIRLWDKHVPRWRATTSREIQPSRENPDLIKKLRQFDKAPSLPRQDPAYGHSESHALSLQRLVSKRRGNWWQLPKDLNPKAET